MCERGHPPNFEERDIRTKLIKTELMSTNKDKNASVCHLRRTAETPINCPHWVDFHCENHMFFNAFDGNCPQHITWWQVNA